MPDFPDDDSRGFAGVEARHLREHYLASFQWMRYDSPSPRTALAKPLSAARVGLLDTSGAHVRGTPPVGATGRAALLPLDAAVQFTHPGYDTARAMEDPDVVHPVHALRRLAEAGVIGEVAPITVSVMGGVLIGQRLIDRGVPVAVETMLDQQVDLALLVPA